LIEFITNGQFGPFLTQKKKKNTYDPLLTLESNLGALAPYNQGGKDFILLMK
jgi:hypothetical protein